VIAGVGKALFPNSSYQSAAIVILLYVLYIAITLGVRQVCRRYGKRWLRRELDKEGIFLRASSNSARKLIEHLNQRFLCAGFIAEDEVVDVGLSHAILNGAYDLSLDSDECRERLVYV